MSADDFDKFWSVYPRRCAKGDARKAWKQTERIRPTIERLLKAVYAARASKQWQKDEGEFIPYPASWLRGERWDDQMDVDLSQLESAVGKVCAYCGEPAQGQVNGKHACGQHWDNAMANERTKVVQIGSKPQEVIRDKKLESCGN